MASHPKSIDETVRELRSRPGIDVTKLSVNQRVLVETTQAVYEMKVIAARLALVEITSTDPRLRKPVIGQLWASHYDVAGRVSLPGWIGRSLRMQLRFNNCTFPCSVTLSASVHGDRFHYDVF